MLPDKNFFSIAATVIVKNILYKGVIKCVLAVVFSGRVGFLAADGLCDSLGNRPAANPF